MCEELHTIYIEDVFLCINKCIEAEKLFFTETNFGYLTHLHKTAAPLKGKKLRHGSALKDATGKHDISLQ